MHRRRGISETATILRAHFEGSAFTAVNAEQVGISARRLGLAVQAGYVVRLRRGLYAFADGPAADGLAVNGLAVNGPAADGPPGRQAPSDLPPVPLSESAHLFVARHRVAELRAQGVMAIVAEGTAALAWGLPHDPLALPTLYVPGGSTVHLGSRYGVRVRKRDVDDAITFRGLPMTSPLATARDICSRLPRYQAVALFGLAQRRHAEWLLAGDDRLDAGDLTQALTDASWRAELREAMLRILAGSPRKHPWCVSADPRPETYLEAISWGRLTGWHLGDMTPQAWVRGASGRLYRVDVLIDGVAGEADGAVKYTFGDTLWKEKRRQEDIEQGGTPVVRWTFAEAEYHPDRLLARWRNALSRRAA